MAANVKEELQKRASGQEEAVRLTKKYVNRADGKGVGTGDPAGASNGSYPGTFHTDGAIGNQ